MFRETRQCDWRTSASLALPRSSILAAAVRLGTISKSQTITDCSGILFAKHGQRDPVYVLLCQQTSLIHVRVHGNVTPFIALIFQGLSKELFGSKFGLVPAIWSTRRYPTVRVGQIISVCPLPQNPR